VLSENINNRFGAVAFYLSNQMKLDREQAIHTIEYYHNIKDPISSIAIKYYEIMHKLDTNNIYEEDTLNKNKKNNDQNKKSDQLSTTIDDVYKETISNMKEKYNSLFNLNSLHTLYYGTDKDLDISMLSHEKYPLTAYASSNNVHNNDQLLRLCHVLMNTIRQNDQYFNIQNGEELERIIENGSYTDFNVNDESVYVTKDANLNTRFADSNLSTMMSMLKMNKMN
jgi:hypothetical protein